MTHKANFNFRKLTQDIPQEKMYIIFGDLISRQLNWKLVDQFMNLQNTFNFETENKWEVASNRQKELVKKPEHHIFYCIMTRGRIEVPAAPKTGLSLTISNSFRPINIITKRSILYIADTLKSPLVIAMQNSPTIILLDSGQHPEKVFPGHLYALLIEVVKFPVF